MGNYALLIFDFYSAPLYSPELLSLNINLLKLCWIEVY